MTDAHGSWLEKGAFFEVVGSGTLRRDVASVRDIARCEDKAVLVTPALAVLPGSGVVAVRYSSHSFFRRLVDLFGPEYNCKAMVVVALYVLTVTC